MQKISGLKASQQRAKLLLCLFFGALLVLGFLTAKDYGIPWDEPEEMDILRMNIWEYSNILGLDTAVFKELAEDPNAIAHGRSDHPLMPISENANRDHGESAYYVLSGVVMSSLSPHAKMMIWRLYTWFLTWFGCVALYHVCRHLRLSRFFSCFAVIMLMLSPRFFAEGHYNNKDIVLMAFVLATLWQAFRLTKKPTIGASLLFSFFGAVAAGTKITGLGIFGLCGLFVVASLTATKKMTKKNVMLGLGTISSFCLIYGLLTPAMWRDPVGFLGYLFSNAIKFQGWGGVVLFRGAVFDPSVSPLPWYYLPYMMLVSTPLWIGLLLAIGQGSALFVTLNRKADIAQRLQLAFISLLWLFPLLFALITHTSVFNGWRHFYFLYGPMLALAAYGLSWLWNHVRQSRPRRRLAAAMLSLCMAMTGIGMALNHPYQYVYYNPLLAVKNINAYLERDYWNVSVRNALKQLAQTEAVQMAGRPVRVAGADLWAQVGVEQALGLGDKALAPLQAVSGDAAPAPDFVLVNHTYQNFSHWKPAEGMAPAVQLIAYGAPLVTVYRAGEEVAP